MAVTQELGTSWPTSWSQLISLLVMSSPSQERAHLAHLQLPTPTNTTAKAQSQAYGIGLAQKGQRGEDCGYNKILVVLRRHIDREGVGEVFIFITGGTLCLEAHDLKHTP
jgi:hypothetical protein